MDRGGAGRRRHARQGLVLGTVVAALVSLWAPAAIAAPGGRDGSVPAARVPGHSRVIHASPAAGRPGVIHPAGLARAIPGRVVDLRTVAGRPHPRVTAAAGGASRVVPAAVLATTATVTANFAGLGSADDSLEPARPSAATSGTMTVEAASGVVAVFDGSGNRACPAVGLSQLLDTSAFSSSNQAQAQVLYDNASGRFILLVNAEPLGAGLIYVAVTTGSDPCGNWLSYQIFNTGQTFSTDLCFSDPSLGQDTGAVLVTFITSASCLAPGTYVVALSKASLYSGFPLFVRYFILAGAGDIAAASSAGNPMIGSPSAYFVAATDVGQAAQGGEYVLYRMDGSASISATSSLTLSVQDTFFVPFSQPGSPLLPNTGRLLIFPLGIQPSAVFDGSRVWFTQTVGIAGGAPTTVRYGFVSPSSGTLQFEEASHNTASADFSPSIGVGILPSGVEAIFLNWATYELNISTVATFIPPSPVIATLLYNGGSLPEVLGADQVLISGSAPSASHDFSPWSSVSVDPAVSDGSCAVTAQQYYAGEAWQTRLARVCGPSTVPVPNVAGLAPDAAGAELGSALLSTGPATTTFSCGPASNGLVVSTSPAAGQQAPAGSPVTLAVCNLNVTVPDVTDFDDANARNAITSAGLVPGQATKVSDCTLFAGEVISTSPFANTTTLRGTVVSLTEANGRQPNGKPCITP
jgi:hypothetical protein